MWAAVGTMGLLALSWYELVDEDTAGVWEIVSTIIAAGSAFGIVSWRRHWFHGGDPSPSGWHLPVASGAGLMLVSVASPGHGQAVLLAAAGGVWAALAFWSPKLR